MLCRTFVAAAAVMAMLSAPVPAADISCAVRVSKSTVSWRVTPSTNIPLGLVGVLPDGRREIINDYVDLSGSTREPLMRYTRVGIAVVATGKSDGGDLLCSARVR